MNQAFLKQFATTIRGLSIDAIESANSGHPGLPLGCAEIFATLYGHYLNHCPSQSSWLARDRFILSAGHGSMALYASLHIAGYNVSLDQIKQFRQLHATTAGHPEYGECDGVETTTGPLGQGIAAGVGMALGQQILAKRFGEQLKSKTVVLAGDGCMMEGVSSEASSFAGHMSLNNLTLIYDANDICLDGPITECFTENVQQRYESYGWHVQTIDGHSFEMINDALTKADQASSPSLIIAKTTIGKGAPGLEGTSEVHGKALGKEASKAAKINLGIPEEPLFYIPATLIEAIKKRNHHLNEKYNRWTESLDQWQAEHPSDSEIFNAFKSEINKEDLKTKISSVSINKNKATRVQSSEVLQYLAEWVPNLIGGSADLSCSDNTGLKEYDCLTATNYLGRNIKYGVREFAMAAIASGLYLTNMFRPYIGTFLMFSDYMRNAIRLSALMKIPVVYQFTHDSVLLGEDGPTHQPVEHLASLRAMPGLSVFRPADENEIKAGWYIALTHQKPTALVLSRQSIRSLDQTSFEGAIRGGYALQETPNAIISIFATGSECALAMDVSKELFNHGIACRVVSLVSWDVFRSQPESYQSSVLGSAPLNVSIEAQSTFGWESFTGRDGINVGVNDFGKSAPIKDIQQHFGLTVESIVNLILKKVQLVETTQ